MACHHHDPEGDPLPGTWIERDAQGIPVGRVCDACVEQVRAKYRPEVFSGYSQADVDEPIEPDDWD